MSFQIKSLTNGPAIEDITDSLSLSILPFNTIPAKNAVYNLYTVPPNKTAIVKSVRLSNGLLADGNVTVALYFNRPLTQAMIVMNRRSVLGPPQIVLASGDVHIDSSEITMEAGDSIQGEADVANAIQYVISGVERDLL